MKQILIISILLAIAATSFGQSLKGKVTDLQKKVVDGALILLKKNGTHVHTTNDGLFILKGVSKNDTLQISHIGYEPKTIVAADPQEELVVQLREKIFSLDEILISQRLDAISLFADVDIQTNPVNSSQELLRKVPGLVIGQHAGGGKAEQIFLRGFDIDHGTDISITVDDLPVNMVSHAHGQGYADLHFVIPETLKDLNFGKGPYYAGQGNFTTAGYVELRTKEKLDENMVKFELGDFNTQRLLGMFDVLNNEKHSSYVASEYILTDGPFESPQNFSRINLMGKYTGHLSDSDRLSFTASHFTSKWDASGQIPQRAVDAGTIGRFGAIDDTEGGMTSRTNILFSHTKNTDRNTFIKSTAYYSKYDFELYSNFTFFLNDPENGDEIRQKESRQLFGLKSELNQAVDIGGLDGYLQAAIGFRNDQSKNNELSHTVNRATTLSTTQLGDINETNMFGYVNFNVEVGKWSINPAIRIDHFKFNYNGHLTGMYETQSESEAIISPKLNLLYNYSDNLQFYLKTGKGFHSNDARVVVAQGGKKILLAAYGADLGFIWKPIPKILVNTAYWYLFLEQEFVYVGDEGIVEPSGKTRRNGFDFGLRYQALKWLYGDLDVNYTMAKATEEAKGNDHIPLAPDLTIMGGLNIIHPDGWYGGLKLRHINDRPANEDNSIVAGGYSVVDMNGGYQWKNLDMGFSIQNLFGTKWNETQFATESRLRNEPEPVEEIHFTPGTPFFFKIILAYKF
jgi:hypothetical protein